MTVPVVMQMMGEAECFSFGGSADRSATSVDTHLLSLKGLVGLACPWEDVEVATNVDAGLVLDIPPQAVSHSPIG